MSTLIYVYNVNRDDSTTYALERMESATYAVVQMPSLGANIKRLRKQRGIGKADLARSIGVVYQRVQDWENDRYERVELTTLFRLARGLRVSIDDLVEGLDDEYESVKRDLVRQGSDLESGRPQDVGGPLDGGTSARVLSLLQDLVAALATQETASGQMREITQRLFASVEASPEGDPTSGSESARRDSDRKAG